MRIKKGTATEAEVLQDKTNRILDGVERWASFYRANPHRFARDYLNLRLKKFQQIILCMMFKNVNSIYLASRGGGKSFLISIFCCIYCILYPGTRICVASKTRGQACEIIEKIHGTLMPNSSNLKMEISAIINNQSIAAVEFRNDSSIVVVTAGESARHNRATVLVVDEFRLVDKTVIDTILRKFLTAQRHPKFLDKKEYENYPKERAKEIYGSSCWYEAHWSYELVRTYVANMINGRSYFCCAMPYQLAIKEGLLDAERIEDEMSETTFSPSSFRMEMEALFFGQNDRGLYSFEEIDKSRKIKYPFYPKSANHRIADKRIIIPQKQAGEIRILSADIALMSSGKNNNDATSIFLNQMLPTASGRYMNNIVYTENNEGLRTDAQALVIRKLFDDFECDYLVIDSRGLGIGVLDALMGDLYDPNSGVTYPALSCCNNDELAKRCAVSNAPKVIWAIQGNPELNSQCALGLRDAFKLGQIRLIKSEFDAEESLMELKGYGNVSPGEEVELKLPYFNTSCLINELINLEHETKNGVVRVKEKTGMRKDRYSSLAYNIYVAKALEREIALNKSRKTIEEMVFEFRAPQIKKKYT